MTEDSKTNLTRRHMLQGGAALAALAASPPALRSLARAQTAPARKLVIVLNSGGWDPTYVLDPKPGLDAVDAPDGDVTQFGGLPIFTHASRPSVTEFFTRYADRVTIVNGLQVRSFVHPDCMKRLLTGSPSETTPDMGAIIAYERARDLPVPYLALGGQARTGPYAAVTGRTGTTNQLSALVDPTAAYAVLGGYAPSRGLEPSAEEQGFVRAYLEAGAQRLAATRGSRGYNARRIEDFLGSLDRADALRAFATETGLGERDYTLDLSVQVPLAARALKDGLSHTVMLQTDDWDTHENNARQSMLHESLFGALVGLVETFESEGLMDETMFLVLSEMGRTPRLNGDMGKDHWPVTSAMLFGAGIQGGRVLGGTSDSLDAQSVDLATGAPLADGNQLQASNFVAGILEAAGVDASAYLPGVEPFGAIGA
jgi:uncharacterized protein (DUF1501 family)